MNPLRVLGHPQLRDTDAPLLFSFTGSSRYVPLLASAGLFASTIVLCLAGPIDWRMDNETEVYGFLVACLVALVAGYIWAVRRRSGLPIGVGGRPLQASAIVVLGSVAYLAIYPLTVYDGTGKWFPDVVAGLSNPGQAYTDKTAAAEHIPQYAVYLGTLVSPLTIAVLPLTMFFWPRLSRLARALGVAVIVLTLALGVARAVNQDVGALCGYIVLFLVLVASTTREDARSRWKRVLACGVGAALVSGLFLAYYHTVISGRVEADTEAANSTQAAPPTETEAPKAPAVTTPEGRQSEASSGQDGGEDGDSLDHAMRTQALVTLGADRPGSLFYSVVPAGAQPTGAMFTSYLTQGYKGLSLAMDSPWRPTYGLGFSVFIRHNASKLLGLDERSVEARTYEGQVDAKGWTAGQQWSSFFIHPASDISFLGVIPFMVLIGFAFGAAWRDTCTRADPVACVVFFYLGIQVLYLSANNQLYQGGQLAVGFTVALVVWLVSLARRRTNGTPGEADQDARVRVPLGDGVGVPGVVSE